MYLYKQKQDEDKHEVVIIEARATERIESRIADLRAERPSLRIIVIDSEPSWQAARAAFDAGAVEYMPKNLGDDELRRRVNEVRRGVSSVLKG